MNKIKGFLTKIGTKGKFAVASVATVGTSVLALSPMAFAAESGGVVNDEMGTNMWAEIGNGVKNFVENVLTPVGDFVSTNNVVLAMLAVTFVGFGIRAIGRAVRAFGRGR